MLSACTNYHPRPVPAVRPRCPEAVKIPHRGILTRAHRTAGGTRGRGTPVRRSVYVSARGRVTLGREIHVELRE